MAINLRITAHDPEVEGLLEYLRSQEQEAWKYVALLERTKRWLEASQAITYTLSPAQCDAHLCVLDNQQAILSQTDAQPIPQKDPPAFLEAGKS